MATNLSNLPHFESSLMAGIVNVHVNSLAERAHSARLVGSTAQWTPEIRIADKAQYFGMHVTVDDLVFRGGSHFDSWVMVWVSFFECSFEVCASPRGVMAGCTG